VLFFLFTSEYFAYAGKATINDIKIDKTESSLKVSFRVAGCFTPKMMEAIKKGVPTSFTFLAAVKRMRSLWFDQKLGYQKVAHTIKYDNLKKVFVINMGEKGGRPKVVKTLEEAKKVMASIVGLKLVPLQELEKGEKYTLCLRVEFEKVRLPLRLEYVFLFVRLLDFTTDWYYVDFSI